MLTLALTLIEASSQSFIVLLHFQGTIMRCTFPSISSIDQLFEKVRCELDLGGRPFKLEYLDREFGDKWVQADDLGLLGHKVELRVVETTPARAQEHVWEWPAQLLKHEGWAIKGFEKTQYKSLLIYDKRSGYQMAAEMAQLNSILRGAMQVSHDRDWESIEKVFATQNEKLQASFQTYQER